MRGSYKWCRRIATCAALAFCSTVYSVSVLATEADQITCKVFYRHSCEELTCSSNLYVNESMIVNRQGLTQCLDGDCVFIGGPTNIENQAQYRTYYYDKEAFLKINMETAAFFNILTLDMMVFRSVGKCEGPGLEKN